MVRQWQELFFKGNYSASVFSDKGGKYLPDLCKIALAHGVKAYRVTEVSKLPTVLKKALRSRTPTFVDVIVDPRANVYPMIPGGKPVSETVFGR
jgi:acetolactate synthase-1/2/3 large subunit